MRTLLLLFTLAWLSLPVSATSYAFTHENCFAQSAIVAEVEVLCRVVRLYKEPENLKEFRVRYFAKRKPVSKSALVFGFRPSTKNEIRAFNGSGGFVGKKDKGFTPELIAAVANFQKTGKAKPMVGFSKGTLEGPKPLGKEILSFAHTRTNLKNSF